MPDPETKIRITGEDKTGPVIKKVGDAFRGLNKDVQAMFKETADKTLISIDQIAKRTMMQSALTGKERLQRVEETSRALHGIIQKNISASNTMAQELNRQNIEAAKAGKVMRTSQEAAGDAAVKSADKAVKSTRSWVATNADLHKFFLKSKEAATDAGKAGADAGDKAGRAHGKANAIVEAGVGALSKMAIGYFSVSKAIDVAKNSFMGFAEMDDKMRLLRGSANLTHKQTEEFAEVIKRTARSVGEDTKQMADAFKIMGDTAGLSYDQIVKIYPQVALMAKGAGVTVGQMSRLVSDTLRNLNIAPEKAGEAMEIMSGGMRKLNVDIGQMGPHMNEITADMTELGYTGVDALTEITAIMGSLNKITGNTTELAEVFQRLLGTVSSEWKNMGFASEQSMMRYLKASDSPMAALVDLIRQSKNQEELFAGMNIRQRRALRQLLKEDNAAIIGDNKKTLAELAKSHEGEKAALERMAGPMQELNKLIVILDQLGEQFGELMDDFGATTAIKNLTDILDNLRRDLKWLHEFWNFAFRGGEAPKPRFSKEEIEEQQKKPFYDRLPMIARPLGEWFTKGMQGPFGAWGPLYGGGGGEHGGGHGPPAATPQSHTGPAQTPVDALGQRVRYVSSALAGPTGSQGSREVYGTSTDAKYLTANYMPSGGEGGSRGYSGIATGGGIGTAPEGMAPAGPGLGRGGTGYDGGTVLAPPAGPRVASRGDTGAVVPSGTPPPAGYGGLVDPITGKLGGGLGEYRSGGGGHAHQGVDLLAPHGSPIYAAGGGTIIRHNPTGSFQKDAVTVVKLDDGREVKYMHHQLDPNLKVGSRVTPGMALGTSGTAAGVGHLHYEMRDPSGKLMDPIGAHGWQRGKGGATPVGGQASPSGGVTTGEKPTVTAGGDVQNVPQDRSNRAIPAPIRFNNPGAQWPSAESRRFGQTDEAVIGGGNKIAGFPSPVHGVASNMALLSRKYVGKSVSSAIQMWSGNHRASVPGYDPNMIITPEMAKDPKFMLPFFRAMQKAEAGKEWMTPEQLQQGYDMYRAGSPEAYAAAQEEQKKKTAVASDDTPKGEGATQQLDREFGKITKPGEEEPSSRATTPAEARPPADTGLIQAQNRDVNMNINVNSSQVQFARNTIDRQVYASLDRSRGNSYHDITTA